MSRGAWSISISGADQRTDEGHLIPWEGAIQWEIIRTWEVNPPGYLLREVSDLRIDPYQLTQCVHLHRTVPSSVLWMQLTDKEN